MYHCKSSVYYRFQEIGIIHRASTILASKVPTASVPGLWNLDWKMRGRSNCGPEQAC